MDHRTDRVRAVSRSVRAPIACSLSGGSYAERLAWIAELMRHGLRSHNRNDLVLRLTYAQQVADRIREMVRKEEECCSFLAFALTEDDNGIQLTITAPERARDVADALFEPFVPQASEVVAR